MIKYIIKKFFGTRNSRVISSLQPIVNKINSFEYSFSKLSDEYLQSKTIEFKSRLENGETLDDILPEAFAVVREASKRTIGLRHFDVQIMGGIILHKGKIAEMKTGEGKTLVATLPVYLNALTGEGVHIVTVNDYLAKRDSEWMRPIFEFLGLSVGLIQHDMRSIIKKEAYKCDLTYITNNELGFDYLRDNMVIRKEDRVLRKLNFAIIDEVDSILIDEARTPLIISGAAEKSTDKYYTINKIVPLLKGKFVSEEEQIDAKYKNEDLSKGYDYLVDEKNHNISLTSDGILKCEKILNIENLYNDMESEWVHHIVQALKAHNLFKRDVDYVVKDNEIIIVDEFTGRLMPGRRWSDGLHQAVEAKENVAIAEENQTLATITFQNFFRMYSKLAGMTGTALTEAEEFYEIYKLDVVEIPTNKPTIREDFTDVIYKSEREKYNAIMKDIIENRKNGRPVLVGTKSIEKSEYLSSLLKKKGVPHQVLNAKYHEQEANIIAQAGRKNTVTIATNMAGRGTDIVLGGNPLNDDEAEIVKNLGGLYIIGTERHDSRRIDNQLRGRSGRQGDAGATRFYISLEDDLMRLFGTDKTSLFTKLGLEEGQDIQHPWISKAIASAQKRVEGMNFDIRKQLIEFDNVMNKQREVVYKQRDMLLFAENLDTAVNDVIDDVVESVIDTYIPSKAYPEEWNLKGLCDWININANSDIDTLEEFREYQRDGIINSIKELLYEIYSQKIKELSKNIVLEIQRIVLLQVVDICWKEHLYNLDQLRKGIGFRAYGQKDPILEYKNEAYKLFLAMIQRIKTTSFEYIFKADMTRKILIDEKDDFEMVKELSNEKKKNNFSQQRLKINKIGRNDICPCGSGKKYKKCCGKN
ncbi:MAG: preprotein translocase subunit SecA [Elusimicrobiota bacterium]|jgi:preprotein translocase subunit SecA|nr:preprotein translocase subunit SecA [Elusimicrobiota bacterium]